MRTRYLPLLVALLAPACVDDASPPPFEAEVDTPFDVAITGLDHDSVTVELVNGRDVDADVALTLSVASSAGLTHTPVAQRTRLAPFARLALTLPRAEVPAFDGAAKLSLTADVAFEDGGHRSATSPLFAVFADDAGWIPGDAEQTIVSAGASREVVEPDDREIALTLPPFITRRLCFQIWSSYTDGGIGEDYWKDKYAWRVLRGADIKVFHDGTSFTSRLGDGLDALEGCIDISGREIDDGELLTIEIVSSGNVNGHTLRVENESTGARAKLAFSVAYDPEDLPYDLTPPESARERFLIYMAASYAMYRHGGTGDGSLTIKEDAAGGTHLSTTSNTIFINDDHDAQKFSIAHEVGHFIARDSGAFFGVTTNNPCGASHALVTKELVRCAALEGFADFYAADVFNDHDETDCVMRINGTSAIDCQNGGGNFPKRYMETKHELPYAGHGVEVDWMRAFWVVHSRGSAPPSMNDLLRWIAAADDGSKPDWNNINVYNLLDSEAALRGGPLNANWNFAGADHGIDHPDD